MGAIEAGMWALGLSGAVKFAVMVLVAILVGCEAGTLQRWSLRRWTEHGIVVGDSREEAERRFFESWSGHTSVPPPAAPTPPPVVREPMSGSPNSGSPMSRPAASHQDVIGLFPQPQSPS
jgi:hypothetical protein